MAFFCGGLFVGVHTSVTGHHSPRIDDVDVRLFPNSRRSGVGLRPKREAQRPLLPQHARHCPVLEAGSALGWLVYAPLKDTESFHVSYLGEGRYRFTYSFQHPTEKSWQPIFSITYLMPVGGLGAATHDVTFHVKELAETPERALEMANVFIAPADFNTPAGAVTLRGAWNFRTPKGWDTVYTPVFNIVERPLAPMMVVRVETDWYAHETEFRYLLQPGESLTGSATIPIGQAFFLPRTEITLSVCDATEIEEIADLRRRFLRDKGADQLQTAYGLPYSPHYLKMSRKQAGSEGAPVPPSSPAVAGPPVPALRIEQVPTQVEPAKISFHAVGRNDSCPCGSGKKYKRCHGQGDAPL